MPATTLLTLILAAGVPAASNTSGEPPATLTLDGGTPLVRAGQASRDHLLGLIHIYNVAVYADGSIDRARLASPQSAKALRIEVTHNNDDRRLPVEWWRELIPRLEAQAVAHLRSTFASLRSGDVVQVEYVPGQGTTIRVGKTIVVSGVNHDLMMAFLDNWIGQRPISEEMKRALLAGA
jgi:hypothetical protein